MSTPTPGTPTPWGGLPTPLPSAIPDVPVDLWKLASGLDTLLKNVIGGTTAPSGPLSPTLIQASASIGSLNTSITNLTGRVDTLNTRVDNLATPQTGAGAERRPWNFSIWATTTTYEAMHTATVPARNYPCLMIAYFCSLWYWPGQAANQNWTLNSQLAVKVDGQSSYTPRMEAAGAGFHQTLTGLYMEKIPTGKGVSLRHDIRCVPGGPGGIQANTGGFCPYIYTIMLPYTGADVPVVPHL